MGETAAPKTWETSRGSWVEMTERTSAGSRKTKNETERLLET